MKLIKTFLVLLCVLFLWSVIKPKNYLTWWLEIMPAIIGVFILIVTFKRFRFTDFVYSWIFISICVILIGGHYTYSDVPLFNWIKETFNQSRNNYDKFGHFIQGVLPVLMAREVMIRNKVFNSRKWMSFYMLTFCIAVSVAYEFAEWIVAVVAGGSADEFLGAQGYIWDAQSDILYATIGGIVSILFLSKYHDNAIIRFQRKNAKIS